MCYINKFQLLTKAFMWNACWLVETTFFWYSVAGRRWGVQQSGCSRCGYSTWLLTHGRWSWWTPKTLPLLFRVPVRWLCEELISFYCMIIFSVCLSHDCRSILMFDVHYGDRYMLYILDLEQDHVQWRSVHLVGDIPVASFIVSYIQQCAIDSQMEVLFCSLVLSCEVTIRTLTIWSFPMYRMRISTWKPPVFGKWHFRM